MIVICGQCGKPAFYAFEGGRFLCVDCNLKVQQAADLEHARNARELNYLIDQMEATVGLSGVLPRHHVPQATIHAGPITNHNIQVHDSVVGAINTGSIQRMNVALDRIQIGGDPALAPALQRLTEAVMESSQLLADQKKKAVDQLSYLAEQAALTQDQRNPSIGTTTIEGFERIIHASSGLVTLWQMIKPLVERLFN
ncbi:MAG TPA: hypothetical protein PKN47_23310 [Nitrospira sp.]|jgi:hypothetical protein|nr:hypothetical protein [Nitrospira sp.]